MENVLVVKTSLLGSIAGGRGLITGREAEVMQLAREHGEFMPRPEAEQDPGFKQIIPYVAVVRRGEVFATTRLNKGGEARLHGKMSLGVGGHMNEVDREGDWLMHCLRREIDEEIALDDFGTLTPRGLINDDSNEVGRVHLGFFFTLTTGGSAAVRETEKLEGGFVKIAELASLSERMETWSQIIVPELERLWTAGKL